MEHKIFKFDIPVDDEWHLVPKLRDVEDIRYVASQHPDRPDQVQLWFEHREVWPLRPIDDVIEVRAFGTGHEISCGDFQCEYVGSAIAAEGKLVWHVYARNILTIRTVS